MYTVFDYCNRGKITCKCETDPYFLQNFPCRTMFISVFCKICELEIVFVFCNVYLLVLSKLRGKHCRKNNFKFSVQFTNGFAALTKRRNK